MKIIWGEKINKYLSQVILSSGLDLKFGPPKHEVPITQA